ncbi:MAG: hypothetical protein V1929_00120 [bacterium]
MNRIVAAATILLLSLAPVHAEVLINPGFEDATGGGTHIRGWTRFGSNVWSVARTPRSGLRCVRVTGESTGIENFSGVYQDVSIQPGSTVRGAMFLRQNSDEPLTGALFALVKIEFFDAATNFITVEVSGQKVQQGSVKDRYLEVSVQAKAPIDAVTARLVGVLTQSATPDKGAIFFDDASLEISP